MTSVAAIRSTSLRLSVEQTTAILADKAVASIETIAGDNERRMCASEDPESFHSGIFYGHEYYKAALHIPSMQSRIETLRKNGSFYHGLAPSTHFKQFTKPVSALYPTGSMVSCFVLKEHVTPADSLVALQQGLSFIDCVGTCDIAYYQAIQHLLGDTKFNALFAADSSTPLTIGNLPENPIHCLTKKLSLKSKAVKGQINQFVNIPAYSAKHLIGQTSTLCTICCDDTPHQQTFTTLGLPPKDISHEDIKEALLDEFNSPPTQMEIVTQEVAQHILSGLSQEQREHSKKLSTLPSVDMESFELLGGGALVFKAELDAEKITKLANTTLRQARLLLNRWFKDTVRAFD